jgi:RNA polymerase sigma-70 factor (ECF subfamily)
VSDEVEAFVADTFREEWSRLVATLIRVTGDWDLAQECAQEAFAQATARWRVDGVPRRPGAWLVTVARNRAVDLLRRRRLEAAKLRESLPLRAVTVVDDASVEAAGTGWDALPDDQLRLIFTCCHPALSLEARVALTLRTLAGLSTAEIARACLVSEATMAKRLVRAKSKIRNAGIPYRVPPPDQLAPRTSGVLAVLYLLFNEGYSASGGDQTIRPLLCTEAIRLARLLARLLPTDPEVAGLLALMLLHDARRESRLDDAGRLVALADQDRTRWRRSQIDEGVAILEAALEHRTAGPYQLQALIAAHHATAPTAEQTDWNAIAGLYRQLLRVMPSPVVELNHAVAVAMSDGPAAGLALVERLAAGGRLAGYPPLASVRADLLHRLGRDVEAAHAYRSAVELAPTGAERDYLVRRLAEVAPEASCHTTGSPYRAGR